MRRRRPELFSVFEFHVVIDSHQAQSVCGGRLAGGGSVAGLDDSPHVIRCPAASPDMDQCADDGSHHIVQKPVGLNVEADEVES